MKRELCAAEMMSNGELSNVNDIDMLPQGSWISVFGRETRTKMASAGEDAVAYIHHSQYMESVQKWFHFFRPANVSHVIIKASKH